MGIKQQKTGLNFEKFFLEYLKNKKIWCYQFPINKGQPCDIIGVRDNQAYFIECKTSIFDKIPLQRLEENQNSASEYIEFCGNDKYIILVSFKSGIKGFIKSIIKNEKELSFENGFNLEQLFGN